MQMLKTKLYIGNFEFTKSVFPRLAFAFIIGILTLIQSCDTCTGVNKEGTNPENMIFFTASPINGDLPNIYRVDADGSNIINIIQNGVMFCPPALNGKIAFIRKDDLQGNSKLFISDLDGSNSKLIIQDNDIFNVSYPVISPDGRYVAFNAGNSRLFYYDVTAQSPVFNQISGRLALGSKSAFSPNSNYLAFIEGDGNTIPYSIKVVDARSTDIVNEIYSKNLGNPVFPDNNDLSLSWSADSKSIIFTLRNSTNDDIYLIDIESKNERMISIPNSEIGGNQPTISPKGDYIAVSGTDGNIWLIFIATNDYRFSNITNSNGFERNHNPRWSVDGKKIMFSCSSQFDSDIFSTLICSELSFDITLVSTIRTYILSNNVYRGFWNNKAKTS